MDEDSIISFPTFTPYIVALFIRFVSAPFICRFDAGSAVAVGGIELTIAARASVAQDSSLNQAESHLHSAMDKALQYVLAHYAV